MQDHVPPSPSPLTSPALLSLLLLSRPAMSLHVSSIELLTVAQQSGEVLEVLGYGLCC